MENEGRADLWGVPKKGEEVPLAGGDFAHQGLPLVQRLEGQVPHTGGGVFGGRAFEEKESGRGQGQREGQGGEGEEVRTGVRMSGVGRGVARIEAGFEGIPDRPPEHAPCHGASVESGGEYCGQCRGYGKVFCAISGGSREFQEHRRGGG